jgi:predicted amino acid dehydrogenase
MTHVLVITLGDEDITTDVTFLGRQVQLRRLGCGGDVERARALIAAHDGQVDAIGLEGLPARLELGGVRVDHARGAALPAAATITPVLDGGGVRPGLERWGVILADRAQPGIFSQKRILMAPGVNHDGLSQALGRRAAGLRYADPFIYFGLPAAPGVGDQRTLPPVAHAELERLARAPFGVPEPQTRTSERPFQWADVIAGDIDAIRRFAPADLRRKTVVVEHADEADLEDLRARGAAIAVTVMPALEGYGGIGRYSAATIEALLAALRPDPALPLDEDTYLNLMADLEWTPHVRALQPEDQGVNKFAFVIHPLDVSFIHKYPPFAWTKRLPDELVEAVAAYNPPVYVGKISGGRSPATGQRIEGYLISLGATPRQMMKHGERFTYTRLNRSARMAERMGARIMGLGAFTSVVGDAGITVAHEADIAITSGNSLTVAATLEAAKQAVIKMGAIDLTAGRAMVIGGTGSIGSVCARLLAQAIKNVVLVSIEPEKLIDLKRTIEAETPGAQVAIATRAGDLVADCDLIVTATSAFGQRIVDITKCKPGAVICDVARPPDIGAAEGALRPDVLVIESGEVLIPGEVEIGYDIGLPPKTVYACLAETSLLAMEGRFEDYTLGRNITLERVKEIYRLFKKHGYQLAGLRSFGRYITDKDVAIKRELAEELRADPERLARVKAEAAEKLKAIPASSKGVQARSDRARALSWSLGLSTVGVLIGLLVRRSRRA